MSEYERLKKQKNDIVARRESSTIADLRRQLLESQTREAEQVALNARLREALNELNRSVSTAEVGAPEIPVQSAAGAPEISG